MIQIQQIHHVAYRCNDAKETVEFYKKYLNMDLLVCIAEDKVPSTKEPNPYMHVFLDAGQGNILAFFELTGQEEMGFDPKTPRWVQHIAFQVKDEAALLAAKEELESRGIEVLGVTEHGIIRSIYFFDPNGHRVELTCVTGTPAQLKNLKEIAPQMLEEWSQTKQPPRQAAWLHEGEFKNLK
ncbi:MAG: glyoxalase [Bdellovibrionaceae bacterium]|nr:glyoxalase [Pseudobdellovibrionaceae bacterium]|tara:strand:+ start:6608 stop:7153 length:546 start_codon:yes stop_codon:yes gene_type:complete